MDTEAKHRSWTHYVAAWIVLLAFTGLSWFASTLHLGALDTTIALTIAIAKSTLVLLVFMHLLEERFTNALVPIVAFLFVVLFAGLTAADVATRHTFPAAPLQRDTSEEER